MRRQRDKEGQRQAYEVLVRPYIGPLYRTALRMTGDGQAAEDLVQDTCLKAYCAFDRFEAGTNFKAWLFRILTNGYIDTCRKHARSPVIASDPIDRVWGDPHGESPEVHILFKDFRSEAFRAMAELPPETRAVVSLSLADSFTYREIADMTGVPVGTVRSRLSRGREILRDRLREFLPTRSPIGGEEKIE